MQPRILAAAATDGQCWSALACAGMRGIDGYGVDVVVAEGEAEKLLGTLIKKAGQGCELAEREQQAEPKDADDDMWKGKRDEPVSGPLSSREKCLV